MSSVESIDQPPYTGTVRDWAAALNLTERRDLDRAGGRKPGTRPLDPEEALRRHDVWADVPIHQTVEQLAQRLAAEGVSVEDYCRLSAGVDMPEDAAEVWPWVSLLETVCRDWAEFEQVGEPALNAPSAVGEALATLVQPFLVWALRGISRDLEELRAGDAAGVLAGERLGLQLLRGLPERLRQFAMPVTVLELHVTRIEAGLEDSEILKAAGPFRERLLEAGWALLREYPVMARTLAELTLQHRRNACELARAVRDDAALLAERFAGGADLGHLVEVTEPLGDAHRGGRAVRMARFSGGCRVLYKPRSLAIDVFIAGFLRWLGSRHVTAALRPVAVLEREGYGWTEVIDSGPCRSEAAVERFYRRQGGLLAVAYVLAAKDLHFENVIAAGEFPVAVDLEGYFQPPLEHFDDPPPPSGPLTELLETGLLPRGMSSADGEQAWFDPSGIAGSGGVLPTSLLRLSPVEEGLRYRKEQVTVATHPNLPVLDSERVPPRDHAAAVEAGFREVCEVVQANAGELLAPGGLLHRAHGLPVRLFLRPSQVYGRLLVGMAHPDLARDALDRERLVDVLWPHEAPSRLFESSFPHERQSLLRGDIPMFATDTDGVEVRSGDGPGTGVSAQRTGFSVVEERVRVLDAERVEDLAWVVRACIAATVPQAADQHWPALVGSRRGQDGEVAAAALRDRASGLARLLVRRVEQGPAGLTWVGLHPVRDEGWSFGRANTGLYDGVSGIALFLAYAGACTGEASFTARACEGVDTLRRTWEARLDAPEATPAATLGGAFGELGGAVLALTHLAVLWDRDDLAREALHLCTATEERLAEVSEHDVIAGLAGTIMVLLTLRDVVRDDALLRMAAACGTLLAERADAVAGGLAWTTTENHLAGFSHGAAGIAAALARLFNATGEGRWWDMALQARRFEDSLYSEEHANWRDMRGRHAPAGGSRYPLMWCHGAPGIAVGRAIMLSCADDGDTARDLRAAFDSTLAASVASTHCLCHGSLGNLLCLRRCEALGQGHPGVTVASLAAGTLQTVDRHGAVTGAPYGVFTPGMMMGAAGVGYGLLALADPALPSLLGVDDLPR